MEAERYQRLQGIFDEVCRLPPEERDAFLDEACAGDGDLRSLVERAVDRLEGVGPDILPTAEGRDVLARQARDYLDVESGPLPESIGPFRILRVLGEGGMGVVYEAEQSEPVSRRVALKVIKLGMDTKELVARFEAERQALAFMEHPGIAQVLDAGATDEGRPWFAMELVDGLPLTQYCDEASLSTRERLELFVEVCGAVQHAHQKGVIHRDLKPSNVLVGERDGRPVPKVIDFGIAKAMGADLTDLTLVTQLGQALGTPAYMAPEQADAPSLGVDTRADVYALGVLLFELLVGRLPFEMQEDWQGLLRALARGERETPTPSRRFSTLTGEERADVARRRRAEPDALHGELRGDLDWIVHRAMNPDRSRRYETASGLAADVVRYLKDEPVVARPPTLGYRTRKFVRRNRLGVAVASLAAVFLLAFSIGMSVLWRRSLVAEEQARREATTAEQAVTFLLGLFQGANPYETEGEEPTVRDLLDQGVEDLAGGAVADAPLVRARLLGAMGEVYTQLGHHDRAGELLHEALTIRREQGDELGTAEVLHLLAGMLSANGDREQSQAVIEEALAIRQRELGPDHVLVAESNVRAGLVYIRNDDKPRARRHLERATSVLESLHERGELEDVRLLNASWMRLGRALNELGEHDEALVVAERVVAALEAEHEPTDPNLGHALDLLSQVHEYRGDRLAAIATAKRALAIKEAALGPDHPNVATTLHNLSFVVPPWESEGLNRRALDIRLRAFGEEGEWTLRSEEALGWSLEVSVMLTSDRGSEEARAKLAEAEALHRHVVEVRRRTQGDLHPRTLIARRSLGKLLTFAGRPEEGAAILREVLDDDPSDVPTRQYLATSLRDLGRADEADALLAELDESGGVGGPP